MLPVEAAQVLARRGLTLAAPQMRDRVLGAPLLLRHLLLPIPVAVVVAA
jgi:hypothetical protein